MSAGDERRRYERRRERRERALLADQLITAEQEERRRLALFLHDGAVQSLAGIALMLDAVLHAIEDGRSEDARRVLAKALERHREAIRSLRDLSFNLEPVVLRDQGLRPVLEALAEQVGLEHRLQVDLELEGLDGLAERVEVALFQILREALNQSIRRGPSRIALGVRRTGAGSVVATLVDDGAVERRRGAVEILEERAATLGGSVRASPGGEGRTRVRIELPAHVVSR